MNKLEKKIINKVYKIETKKTVSQILSQVILVTLIIFSLIFIFSVIIEILYEQGSFDLYNFIQDDLEVSKQYFFQNTLLFIRELPFPLVYVFILLIATLLPIIYAILKNFSKIKNILISLYKFWFK